MRNRRAAEKRIARARVDSLFKEAIQIRSNDNELAQRYAKIALKIGKRSNVRFSRQHRMLICRHCKSFIFPGFTSRVRTQPRREPHLVLTCLLCGGISRIPLKKKQQTVRRSSRVSGNDQWLPLQSLYIELPRIVSENSLRFEYLADSLRCTRRWVYPWSRWILAGECTCSISSGMAQVCEDWGSSKKDSWGFELVVYTLRLNSKEDLQIRTYRGFPSPTSIWRQETFWERSCSLRAWKRSSNS